MAEHPEALEAEIQRLEQQLAQKRTERGADASAPYERTEVQAAVGEHIQQAVPSYQPSASSGGTVPSYQDPALAASVQQLVNTAFTKSIKDALMEALKSGNPALIDAFHDVLVDELHQELLNRQKLQPAP